MASEAWEERKHFFLMGFILSDVIFTFQRIIAFLRQLS